ncbi:Uncharacterised protein [uncultured archaeon]|nr:Uncharacterised protein [uncultured archaeon]
MTNFWNYIADVPRNIWLSNETPYYVFRQWNNFGRRMETDSGTNFRTLFRFGYLNTFNSFTASEYNQSMFIDPTIQVAPTQLNGITMWNDTIPQTTCIATRFWPEVTGWHFVDRSCYYEEVGARNTSSGNTYNI